MNVFQVAVFLGITALIGALTFWQCRKAGTRSNDSTKEYFLAGGGLSWFFVAGSITLTNLSTDQLVGMNGGQMALLAWWELAAVLGLAILAFVFVPIYYKHNCTTTTELLEIKYGSKSIRSVIALMFLAGNVFIFMPIALYTGSLFMQSMFGVDMPILAIAAMFAAVGAAYAIFGGLRAVAVSDTFSGILLLSLAMVVTYLSLDAIDFDFSDIPVERLTLVGDSSSPIPWQTLFTGMIFIQIFYWSTNQTITQRAMAAPSVREAQKGVMSAAAIRLLIIPPIIVLPGIASYALFGDVGDLAFGKVVAEVLPPWLSGAFAAAIAAAVLTTYNSLLNSSAALVVVDFYEAYIDPKPNVPKISGFVTASFVVISLFMVEFYNGADSIINLVQKLNGLLSMPILSVFLAALIFPRQNAQAAIISLLAAIGLYAYFAFVWEPYHYIHMMAVVLACALALHFLLSLILPNRRALQSA